jgi:alkylhydroperoxidase family enzyme
MRSESFRISGRLDTLGTAATGAAKAVKGEEVMVTSSGAPRIPPMETDEMDDHARELVERGRPGSGVRIFRTLLWHADIVEPYQAFGSKLRRGLLPTRHLEMIILRIAFKCGAPTEWAGHVLPARDCGLSDEEIARIAEGPDAPGWEPSDATVLRAVDELHDKSDITDATWADLAAGYDRRQLIEFVLVVGNYHMLSYAMNAFRIEPEPEWPKFLASMVAGNAS